MERQRWIDICKGIAIILVVIGHVETSYHNSGLYLDSPIFNYVGGVIYAFHMPLFFMISGYLSGISNKQLTISQLIKKRAISYGVPYIIFSALIVLAKIIASPFVNNKLEVFDFVKIVWYPISSLWFIYALLIISIFHELLRKYAGGYQIRIIILMSFLFGLMVLADLINQNKLFSNTVLQDSILIDVFMYAFWYELGMYLRIDNIAKRISDYDRILATILISVFALTYSFVTIEMIRNEISYPLLRYILAFVGSALIICISCIISKSRLLEMMGKTTLPIYLLHPYVVSVMRIVLGRIGVRMPDFLILTIISTATLIISLTFYKITSRIWIIDFCFFPNRYLSKKQG